MIKNVQEAGVFFNVVLSFLLFLKQFKLPLSPLSSQESALNQKDTSLGSLSEVIAIT